MGHQGVRIKNSWVERKDEKTLNQLYQRDEREIGGVVKAVDEEQGSRRSLESVSSPLTASST